MTTKFELANYCANLLTIMESRDSAGAIGRGRTLGEEYNRAYDELMGIIKKEHEDEARKSQSLERRSDKDRADFKRR